MTAKDLFSNNPDYLESLSEEEVTKALSPYFRVTRVDEAKRRKKDAPMTPRVAGKQRAIKANKNKDLEAKMRLLGI